jgi:YcxB-like protein
MTAEYDLTKDDLTAFNLYHHRHSPTARRQYLRAWFTPAILWLLVCTGIWYLADMKRDTPLQTFLDLLPLFSGAAIHLALFPWLYRRRLRKIIGSMVSEGENRGLFDRRRVTMSAQEVIDASEFSRNSTAWRSVERVVISREYLYIYTNALAAIILPERAFADRSEFDTFARTATEYYQKART